MRKIFDQNIYFDRRRHAAFPSASTLPDGTIVLAFRRARDDRHLLGAFRDDGATTDLADFDRVDHLDCRSHIAIMRLSPSLEPLEGPSGAAISLPVDPDAGDQDPNLLLLRSGRLLQTGFGWRPTPPWIIPRLKERGVGVAGSPAHHGVGFVFWGGYARWSDDAGRSWSDRRDLPIIPGLPELVPGERPYFGGPVRGRAVETADGGILQASYFIRPNTGRGAAALHQSRDGGETWRYRGVIAEDADGEAGFLEPALVQAENGKLFAFHRTSGLKGRIAVSTSRDGGENWSPWRATAAAGHPCDALPLPNGDILVAYGRRHPPYGVRARLWRPDKECFRREPEFIVRDDAPSPDVGYPWLTPLPDGKIVVFYYIAAFNGVRGVAASVLEL